jgi:hypothetical protein
MDQRKGNRSADAGQKADPGRVGCMSGGGGRKGGMDNRKDESKMVTMMPRSMA